ncbi:MAG: hypothetical protein Q9157_002870 [Trypethelium eluteriae]
MASPTTTLSTLTTVLETKDLGNGKYEVKEIPSDEASFPDLHSGNRKQIEFPLPIPGFAVVGYFDVDDKEIGAYLTLAGSQVGTKYTAGLDTGLEIGVNLGLGSGTVRIYKEGSTLKVGYGISVGIGPFSKSYNDSFALFDI